MQIAFHFFFHFHYDAPELFPVLWAEAFLNSQFLLVHMRSPFFSQTLFAFDIRIVCLFSSFILCTSLFRKNLLKLTAAWMRHRYHCILILSRENVV